MGIDLGTTVCKSFVFDSEQQVLGSAASNVPLITLSGGEVEQDAEAWWRVTREVVRKAVGKMGEQADRIRGLSVSAQGISFVPVDADCRPLRRAFSWMDTRATEQMRSILSNMGEKEVFSITGKRCSECYVLPKLIWLREREPEIYKRTHKILMPLDFLLARMTTEFVTDHTMASGTMLYDITDRDWSPAILDLFGIESEKLPALRWAGAPVGRLRPRVAEELGLPDTTVVAVGGQDQKVAALGAGIDLDRTTASLGTAMAITQKSTRPVIDPNMRVPCFTYLVEGRWVIEGSADCCNILDWLKQTFFPDIRYMDLDAMAEREEMPRNPVSFCPFFSGAGPLHRSSLARGSVHGLDFSTSPGQIVRSFFESVAYLIRANIDVMEELSRPVRELRIFGGGAKSDVWCQIIADVINIPVNALNTSEAASVGAAILAGLGSKVFAGVEDAFPKIAIRTTFLPRKAFVKRYRDGYHEYAKLLDRNLAASGGEPADEGGKWAIV